MDTDIRKPDTGAIGFDRPGPTPTASSNETSVPSPDMSSSPEPIPAYTEPISEGEDDEDELNAGVDRDELQNINFNSIDLEEAREAIRSREEMLKKARLSNPDKQKDNSDADDEHDCGSASSPRRLKKKSAARPDNLAIDPLASWKRWELSVCFFNIA